MKEIINEWRQFLLTEVQTLKLIDLATSAKENGYSQNDIQLLTQFWNNNSKIRSKYSKVIEKEISDPNKNEPIKHILSAVINHYKNVYDKLSSDEKMKLASAEDIDIGKLRVQADLAEQEAEDNIDPMKFRSRGVRDQCKYENGRPDIGKYSDFDVVYSSNDWVVIDPKTFKGSIAWAHGKPDGSEETEEEYRVTWCTGTKSTNQFLSYAAKYHMFYCISTDYEDVKINKPENRRICLSFDSEGNLKIGDMTVNGENDEINKEEVLLILRNNRLYEGLKGLSAERTTTRVQKIIDNSTYEEFINTHGYNKDVQKGISEAYVENCNINSLRKIINSEIFFDVDVRETIAYREDLSKLEGGKEIIRKLSDDDDDDVRIMIAHRGDLLELEDGKEIIRKLSEDESTYVRNAIAKREDFLELEDGKEIIRKLAEDEDDYVRRCIAERDDLLEVDPNGNLIRALANDGSDHVRLSMANNPVLSKFEVGKKIIRKLAEDESIYVRLGITQREDFLELEDGKEIIRKLAEDENIYVRLGITRREDLLELEDGKEIIRKLAEDEDERVRKAIMKNYKSIIAALEK